MQYLICLIKAQLSFYHFPAILGHPLVRDIRPAQFPPLLHLITAPIMPHVLHCTSDNLLRYAYSTQYCQNFLNHTYVSSWDWDILSYQALCQICDMHCFSVYLSPVAHPPPTQPTPPLLLSLNNCGRSVGESRVLIDIGHPSKDRRGRKRRGRQLCCLSNPSKGNMQYYQYRLHLQT